MKTKMARRKHIIRIASVSLFFMITIGFVLAQQEKQCQDTKVRNCHDGDTCTSFEHGRMRLYGIDAPEIGQPFSLESRDYLWNKIQESKHVCIVSQGKDRYGRELVVIMADSENLNLSLIQQGLAEAFFLGTPWSLFVEENSKAKQKKLGIWSQKKPIRPSHFRKLKKNKTLVYPIQQY